MATSHPLTGRYIPYSGLNSSIFILSFREILHTLPHHGNDAAWHFELVKSQDCSDGFSNIISVIWHFSNYIRLALTDQFYCKWVLSPNFLYCAVPENNLPRMVIGNLHNSVNKIYRYKIRNLKDNICFQKSTQLFLFNVCFHRDAGGIDYKRMIKRHFIVLKYQLAYRKGMICTN